MGEGRHMIRYKKKLTIGHRSMAATAPAMTLDSRKADAILTFSKRAPRNLIMIGFVTSYTPNFIAPSIE